MNAWENYLQIKDEVGESVRIVAVSKKQPVEKVQSFLDSANSTVILGENFLQEYQEKQKVLKGDYQVHLIGAIQSNKVKHAVGLFDVIESVHSEKVAKLVSKFAQSKDLTQKIFLQVNISEDEAKSGFLPEDLIKVFSELDNLPNVDIQGLMTITKFYENKEDSRPDFRRMRELRDSLPSDKPLLLSMGMSADYQIAISEGADIVRIGTDIFGIRG